MKTSTIYFISAILFVVVAPLQASSLVVPKSFTAGTPAVAADVNANFTAVQTSVDDNDTRITTNATGISEKRPYRIGGSILAAASVDITDMAGELGLNFRMTMGNLNTPNAYVHITCSGQESNNISGCFAWGPGSVGPTSFNIFTTQTATSLTTTRGQIGTISQTGVFRITNNTGGTISFNVLIEPSFTNPN